MFQQSIKVFLACFFGATIGAFTALHLNSNFWWLGLLVGGIVGYMSYEWRKVLAAIPVAAHKYVRIFNPPVLYENNLYSTLLFGIEVAILALVILSLLLGLTTLARILPYNIVFFLPRILFLIGNFLYKHVPTAIAFLKTFTWQLFLEIHSEIRLLCGLDAMLGAAIGYFAGSVPVGAIAGGLLGVINYAVITERWLKPRGYIKARIQ